jgi:hypothetical protein
MGRYRSPVQDQLVLQALALLTNETQQLTRLLDRPVPRPIAVRLIIDTGSRRSSLVPWVLDQLKPPPYKAARVQTSVGSLETELLWVRLEFPDRALAAVPELAVARLPLPAMLQGFHGLVGRDLLGRCESFFYEGRLARFTIRDIPGGLFGWLQRR